MKAANHTLKHSISSVMMILALVWLTISLPYVYAAQQQLIKQKMDLVKEDKGVQNDDSNPFANTTEEKAPNNNTTSEEYLHHHDEPVYLSANKLDHSAHHSYDVYIAFYGELLSPPPDASLS